MRISITQTRQCLTTYRHSVIRDLEYSAIQIICTCVCVYLCCTSLCTHIFTWRVARASPDGRGRCRCHCCRGRRNMTGGWTMCVCCSRNCIPETWNVVRASTYSGVEYPQAAGSRQPRRLYRFWGFSRIQCGCCCRRRHRRRRCRRVQLPENVHTLQTCAKTM